ncbi:MAG: undecaprenyldiphospho-muramoylpentapeptide beta-N-acetylglucosaminyltransferase [Alphaproteobacteria bacterium]|nr:undecaprenyldiphospho-muramoylpentapeptide beta-N-acetylglucosaminyltransferase [Alphaproteobacteria bacterium]
MATIVLAGGGTGGHVYPALAIGDVLRARGHRVIVYGDPDRLEARVAPQRGFPFRPVQAAQFPRTGVLGKVRFLWSLLVGVAKVRTMLAEDGADAVFGVGGYIAAPTVLAGWTLGRRTIVHEANVVPGLANQLCARVADRVLVTFEATVPRLPGPRTPEVVGVPVDPAVLVGDRAEAAARYGLSPDAVTVMLVGGSLGAARINELALALARRERAYQVLHLCGPRFEADVRAALGDALPPAYALVPYEDRMGQAYALADLVVSRAGSVTLAELSAVGRAAVLVPSPHVTENHQEHNARGLARAGAAEVLVEDRWVLDEAVARVEALLSDREGLGRMGEAARLLAHPGAAEHVADVVLEALHGKGPARV